MINTDYVLNSTDFNLISLNPIYQLENTNPIESDYYDQISSINVPQDSFDNPVLNSQQNLLNMNSSIGYMQKAYDSLNTISSYTKELSTLSQTLQNTTNTSDKTILENDMQNIYNQITDYEKNSTYNGVNIFNNDIQMGDSSINLKLPKLDITNPESIDNFSNQINTFKDDIKSYLETSSLHTDSFVNSLDNEIYPEQNNQLNLLDKVDSTNLLINADLLAVAHNQDSLSQNIQQLLL